MNSILKWKFFYNYLIQRNQMELCPLLGDLLQASKRMLEMLFFGQTFAYSWPVKTFRGLENCIPNRSVVQVHVNAK